MFQIYFLNFCETLKKFICEEKFCIKTEIFGELYELTYDIRDEHFNFVDSRILLPKNDDAYSIIKNHVFKMIAQKQKETCDGNLEKKEILKLDLKFENKKQETKFFRLLNVFKKYLLEEPIFFCDIPLNVKKLKLGFQETKVSEKFLQKIVNTIAEYPKSLEYGEIFDRMWNNLLINTNSKDFKESLIIFKQEGYIKFSEENFDLNVFDVFFTEKFYLALKLAIFNEVYHVKEITMDKF